MVSVFALRLEREGVAGGGTLKGLVFLTILLTVVLQGLSAPWLAQRLGLVEEPDPSASAGLSPPGPAAGGTPPPAAG